MLVVQAGFGRFGKTVAALLDATPGARLVAVCDPAGVEHPKGSEHLWNVLEVMRPEVLVVAVPPAQHVEVCEIASKLGVSRVRVEKPCGRSAGDARRIAALGMDVRVGFTTLHLAGYVWLKANVFARDRVLRVRGTRLSPEGGRHESAAVDMGSHTAAMAVDLGCDQLSLRVGYGASSQRVTIFDLASGREVRMVEDAAGQTVRCGRMARRFNQAHPLLADLEASIHGRGPTAEFAADVHDLLAAAEVASLERAVVA